MTELPEETEIEIERLAAGGDGVGRRSDGLTVFVPFAAPGDRLRVAITERKARHARGQIVEVLRAGPGRREPGCKVFGVCGGCAWQHLTYATQLEAKRQMLVDAIERIARLRVPAEVAVRGSEAELGYRSRARLQVEGGRIGFRRLHSHALEPIEHCPVLAPPLDAALPRAAELGARAGVAAEVELALGADGTVHVVLDADEDGDDAVSARPVELAFDGDRLRISPGVFAQANASLLEPLTRAVRREAGGGTRAAELFAGAGLFTLGLARAFEQVLAVEANERATRDLAFNLERIGAGARVEILTRPVERALRRLRDFAPEVVVLDPPRTGLVQAARAGLGGLGARRLVYVSCDPATLARDLRALCDRAAGLALVHLEAFDLFPQTPHVEALAVLEAGGERSAG